MAISEFDVQVRNQPELAILDLHGEINGTAEGALSNAYDEVERTNANSILLNFEDVTYINSTGIALIVSLLGRARAGRRRMMACGLSEHYVEIFNITRLVDFMSVFPDESTALSDTVAAHPTS